MLGFRRDPGSCHLEGRWHRRDAFMLLAVAGTCMAVVLCGLIDLARGLGASDRIIGANIIIVLLFVGTTALLVVFACTGVKL